MPPPALLCPYLQETLVLGGEAEQQHAAPREQPHEAQLSPAGRHAGAAAPADAPFEPLTAM
jgi:hypothetical protein